ncbi:MAG: DUF4956 domain-containing protein, partial [Bacteroidota bacterium]|nr:DUF4956 domain-containing protein [Bacteroidota bacterium]
VVNAIANSVSIVELLATNALMFGSIWLWEIRLKQPPSKLVQYDRIELIVPERREELMADLTQRLGLRILDVEIGSVDFLRDMAMLKVFYESDHGNLSVNDMLKLEKDDLQAFN